VRPWFQDHHFNGQTIFPAVESMLLLASFAREHYPCVQPNTILRAKFSKFLAIEDEQTELNALIEVDTEHTVDTVDTDRDAQLCVRLLSLIQLKKMSRIQEHARVYFPLQPLPLPPAADVIKAADAARINSRRIYEELVPFGPCYRSLVGDLHLTAKHAWGKLQAADPGQQPMQDILGSPFPLDGAMHAACVLGQCISGFVPFPVAFEARHIARPTRGGEHYNCTVSTRSLTPDTLLVDLVITDEEGTLYEMVQGLQMRDVSRGTIKPASDLPRLAFSKQ
jgi:hypothetical protein